MICLVIEKTSGRKKTINRDSLPCITATDVSLIDGEIRIFAKPWEPEVSEYARELEAQAHAFNRAEGVRKAKITRAKNKAAKAQKEGKQY
jgi:hypothetical protein